MSTQYPAPRWFREAVQSWIGETPYEALWHRTGDLWTRITNAQPPDLRLIKGEPPSEKSSS